MHEAEAADRGYDRGGGTSAAGPGADCQSRKLDSGASSASRMNWQDDLGWSLPECPFPPPHEGWVEASAISFSFRTSLWAGQQRPPPPASPSLCSGASLGLSLQHHKYLQLISGLRGLSVSDRPPLRTQEIPRSRPGIPKWPYLPQPSIELSSEWIPIKLIFCHQVYNTSPPTGLKC